MRAAIAAGVVCLLAVAGVAGWALLREDAKATPEKKAAQPTTTTTTAPASMGAVTATQKVSEVTAYQDAIETSAPVTKLTDKTEYGLPRTYLVTDQTSRPGWLNVLLPIRPNGASGWIKASAVTLGKSDYAIRIELGAHKLTLLKLGQPVLDSSVVIGADKTPTPPGKFYVTDPLDLHSQPNAGYGVFALGISGYSNVLTSFKGGPGQLAVHGSPPRHPRHDRRVTRRTKSAVRRAATPGPSARIVRHARLASPTDRAGSCISRASVP
jgi:L,D-transpeptidase catalytic domain